MCTYEGENTVLLLQTARFLIKIMQNPKNVEKLPTVKYLANALQRNEPFNKTVEWIISELEQIAAHKLNLANRHINERVAKGKAYEDAWNETSIELVAAADAHCRAMIVNIFNTTVKKINNISPQLKAVLGNLVELYAVNTALRLQGDLLRVSNAAIDKDYC